jgi:hypothetical protein
MNRRANFQNSYRNRYLIFALVFIPGALYFFYDGFIGYPMKLPAAKAYDELKEKGLSPKEQETQWRELAKKNGWSVRVPEKTAEEWKSAIKGQYFWGSITAVVGAIALLYYRASKNAWVERTERGIKTSWGQEFSFSSVSLLDKKKWASKGIAKAAYSHDGKKMRFVFDDFKFEREPLGVMLYELEQSISRIKIVGGPPEPLPDALKRDAAPSELQAPSESDASPTTTTAAEKSS